MKVRLAYGTGGLDVEVPDDAVVVRPRDLPALPDEPGAVAGALRAPVAGPALPSLLRRARSVAVVFPDLTRPMPNRTVLPPLLAALERAGVADHALTLLCATGTHRRATDAEMRDLVGPDIVDRYRIVDHDSESDDHVGVGAVDGVAVRLQREYVDADVRIVTGFVEPHFFAGFSGGPKAVCPGLAATETILEAHHPRRIADTNATFVTRHGNPVHDFVRAAVALCPPHLSVDVAINRQRQLTAVYAGSLPDAHDAACAFVGAAAVQVVDEPFDVVVSTNGGHPLDRNLYQTVKGMAAAERIVRPGGIVVMAAACGDGVPDGGGFARMLQAARTPHDLVDAAGGAALDRWQAQVLGRVLHKAAVWLRSDGLDDARIRSAQLVPVHDLSRAVAEAAAGAGGRIAVLPEGPFTVASVGTAVRAP